MKLIKYSIFVLGFLFLSACVDSEITVPFVENEQEIEEPTNIDLSDNFGLDITRSFIGNIIDINNNPVENVEIKIGSKTATTDNNGVFIINNASVFEKFAYVVANKSGYVHGSRTLVPTDGVNKVTIMLLEENIIDTTQSGIITTISLSNGATVKLNGDYKDENGNAYTGSVDVILHHLDPADDNMFNQMPGMLYAATTNNEEVMLESFGMLAIELRGSNGEDLNIANDSTAEITIPLDSALLADAPSTIPLWYFDEVRGYWIEDGQAILQGDKYVGTVTHFSFWNVDIWVPTVSLCINVTDENGNPIANQLITLHNPDLTYPTSSGITNENGQVCGLIPLDMSLLLNAISYDICGNNPILTTNIGPFSTDVEVDIVITTSSDIISESVIGNFTNCDGNAITNGYIILNYGNNTFFDTVNDGIFEINLFRCNDENTFSLEAIDLINFQSSGEINYTFNTPSTDLGNISSCNDIEEFIQYTIDDGIEEFLAITNITASFVENDPTNPTSLPTITIYTNSQDCFYLEGRLYQSPYIGVYDAPVDSNNDDSIWDEVGFYIGECIGMSTTNDNVIYNLTNLGEIGEYIDINFAGDYEDFNGNPHTITGVIHVIRDN